MDDAMTEEELREAQALVDAEGGDPLAVADLVPRLLSHIAARDEEVHALLTVARRCPSCGFTYQHEGASDTLNTACVTMDGLLAEAARLTVARDAWADAGQQIVDLFDPLKHRADPGTLVMSAKAVKEANAEIRARLAQVGAALRERIVQVSGLQERVDTAKRLIDELTSELAAGQKASAEIAERIAEALLRRRDSLPRSEWKARAELERAAHMARAWKATP